MKKLFYIIGTIVLSFWLTTVLLSGCKRFADIPPVVEEYKPDTSVTKTVSNRKVLLISIDGLKGDFLKANMPVGINNLLSHSKYMFVPHPNAYFPINSTSSWGSMLTGNAETRLWDSTFYAIPDTTIFVPLPANITVVRYIKNIRFSDRIVVISPWRGMAHNLLAEADVKTVTSEDEETKNELIKSITNDSAVLTIAQFTGVRNAGKQYGFSSDSYKEALQQVDAQISAIVNAVKSRSGYANEKWLTLITTAQMRDSIMTLSNYQKTGQYIPEFIIAYNEKFTRQDLSELKPALYVKREDVTANILYWLKMPGALGVKNGLPWLNNFELEAN